MIGVARSSGEGFATRVAAWARCLLVAMVVATVAGCMSIPPGAEYPRTVTSAFSDPAATRLGRQIAVSTARHPGLSGFRLLPHSIDGLTFRTQLIRAAQRSLDIQYYIFAEDDSGKLLQQALLDAADRGVRVRLLIDDSNSFGDAQSKEILAALNDHRNIDLRLFNPFTYRGNFPVFRYLDYAATASRINHRMHNKLFVVDGALAIVGGRNVADEYFDTSTATVRFGDFDVAAVGPVVPSLAATFDEYWNCALSIPQKALAPVALESTSLPTARAELAEHSADGDMRDLERRVNAGEPLKGLLEGRPPLVWANATVIVDPPEKVNVAMGERAHSPIVRELMQSLKAATTEVAIVSPYFVPGEHGLGVLEELRQRNVRVRILTNSLSSTDVPLVHGAYRKYREPLVAAGAELFEVRAVPGQLPASSIRGSGSGGSDAPFALHAKIYVFDRKKLFIGSANFDRRSFQLNTELGLMIDSPELARQIVTRFDQFASPANSYRVVIEPKGTWGSRLRWQTQVDGRMVELDDDPDTKASRRLQVDLTSLLPLDELL